MYNKNDYIYDTKYYEKSLGLSPADLLVIEIKKPNRPIIQKKGLILRKSSFKNIESYTFIDEPKYKDPKVRNKYIINNF